MNILFKLFWVSSQEFIQRRSPRILQTSSHSLILAIVVKRRPSGPLTGWSCEISKIDGSSYVCGFRNCIK